MKGPKTSAPEQALEGFLRKTGLTREQLVERDGVLFAVISSKGRATPDLIPAARSAQAPALIVGGKDLAAMDADAAHGRSGMGCGRWPFHSAHERRGAAGFHVGLFRADLACLQSRQARTVRMIGPLRPAGPRRVW